MRVTVKDFETFRNVVKFVTRHYDYILENGLELPEVLGEIDDKKKLAEKLSAIMNRCSFGCQQENVAELFSVMLGEEVRPGKSSTGTSDCTIRYAGGGHLGYFPFLAVVPIEGNPNGHSYPLDQMVVIITGDEGVRSFNEGIGNHLPSRASETGAQYVRNATEEEIDAWFDWYLTNKQVDGDIKINHLEYLRREWADRHWAPLKNFMEKYNG